MFTFFDNKHYVIYIQQIDSSPTLAEVHNKVHTWSGKKIRMRYCLWAGRVCPETYGQWIEILNNIIIQSLHAYMLTVHWKENNAKSKMDVNCEMTEKNKQSYPKWKTNLFDLKFKLKFFFARSFYVLRHGFNKIFQPNFAFARAISREF